MTTGRMLSWMATSPFDSGVPIGVPIGAHKSAVEQSPEPGVTDTPE
jgi:hypothetical protein